MAGSPLRELLVFIGVEDDDALARVQAFDEAFGDLKGAAGDLVDLGPPKGRPSRRLTKALQALRTDRR